MLLTRLPMLAGRAAACQTGSMMGATACGHDKVNLFAAAAMAAVAVLGWWVLRQAEKDAGPIRLAGRVTGWVLLVVGLAGLLCGATMHAVRPWRSHGCHAGATREAAQPSPWSPGTEALPPGHPPLGGTRKK